MVGGVAHPASINMATNGKRIFLSMFRSQRMVLL
ncbi:hypothetical protein KP1_1266 [Klebsiella pneumoniae subsp. pneumoniae NTUH-K2044]|nr:hypothetical protein KP1_1266 [Klebsiella pneumoniae subsp. pneumoniae NTUH-K2044]